MLQIHFICVFFAINHVTRINCINYRLYEITAFNQRERRALYFIYSNESTIYFMNGISNEAAIPINVIVEEQNAYAFEIKLHANNIQYAYLKPFM